ncbi:response regulator [Zobellia nedashkovskayae]
MNQRAGTKDEDLPLVLIIEDNKDVAYYLKQCLKDQYKMMHAINGIEGLEMAFEHIPDIIISDVMMPGKDGYEVCSMLKTVSAYRSYSYCFINGQSNYKRSSYRTNSRSGCIFNQAFYKRRVICAIGAATFSTEEIN